MSSDGSITHWLAELRAGNAAAAQPLWERYFSRLVGLARQKLRGLHGLAADEEDVALSAFDSFCRGAEQGRFPQLHDRDNLWGLLLVITARKAAQLVRDARRLKRGGGTVLDEAALAALSAATPDGFDLGQVVGREPTPEFAARLADECRHLLGLLEAPELRAVAVGKLEGYSNAELAAQLGCVPRTVERMLRTVRELWSREDGP